MFSDGFPSLLLYKQSFFAFLISLSHTHSTVLDFIILEIVLEYYAILRASEIVIMMFNDL